MQYIFLRGIIDSTLANFHCPHCQSKALEQNIQITALTAQTIDISIICPQCHANTLLHAEINPMAWELMNHEHGQKFIQDFLAKGWTVGAQMMSRDGTQMIKDEDITKLYKDLKNINTVEDILGKND